jgi:hypothetical protein
MPTVYAAEPLAKGSRVEVCSQDDAAGTPKWYQAVVVQFGKNDRDDKVRVQYAAPGEEPGEDAHKVCCCSIVCLQRAIISPPECVSQEWKPLAAVRPAPPATPDGWLSRIRTREEVETLVGDGFQAYWLPVVFECARLPTYDGSEQLLHVQCTSLNFELDAPVSRLRPVWQLDSSPLPQWTLTRKRVGPIGSTLLLLRCDESSGWEVEQQLDISPVEPLHSDGPAGSPTALETVVQAAASQANTFTILLQQQDGDWSFGGDGRPGTFVPPLASLPSDTHVTPLAVGAAVEVGPTEEGYIGSWYSAKVTALEGGPEPGHVQIQYDSLEESDGVPLREWQPPSVVRPVPPATAPGAFPPDEICAGTPLQMFYNDGWWECIASVPPELGKKELKEQKRRRGEYELSRAAAEKAGITVPEYPPDLVEPTGENVYISFLHYNEAFGYVERDKLRPAWTWRAGAWYWRVLGGAFQALTNRMADGKVNKDGLLRPAPKRVHVPGASALSLELVHGQWQLATAGGDRAAEADDDAEGMPEWTADVTTVMVSGVHMVHSCKLMQHARAAGDDDDSPMALFSVGQQVEVSQEDEGYEGAWFTAQILELLDEAARVVYHAFFAEEGSNAKLEDTVQLRRLRPAPPVAQPRFVETLSTGDALEMLFEDGWWQAVLSSVEAAADGSAIFVLRTVWHSQTHHMSASDLRPCFLWLWRSNRWEVTRQLAALDTHYSMTLDDEQRRIHNRGKRDKRQQQAEAKRAAKQDGAEAKRRAKDAEREAKRAAKEADEVAKREARAAEQEEKKRKRDEEAAERQRRKDEVAERQQAAAAESLESKRQKWRSALSKKGFGPGAAVEAPMRLTASPEGEDADGDDDGLVEADDGYAGSWYAASMVEVINASSVLIAFEMAEDMPTAAKEAAADGQLHRAVKVASLRPAIPGAVPDTYPQLIEPGSRLEMRRDGGWWEVEVVSVSGDLSGGEPDKGLIPGRRVQIAKPDGEHHRALGTIESLSNNGWVTVVLDSEEKKNFREGELRLVVKQEGDGGDEGSGSAAAASRPAAAPASPTEAPTLAVRLVSASGDDSMPIEGSEAGGIFTVGLDALRPGWSWIGGKWAGAWIPKVKSKRQGEREAAFQRLKQAWPLESFVEVMQNDPGMAGSWYEGHVTGYEYPDKMVIRYLELHDLGEEAEAGGGASAARAAAQLGSTRRQSRTEPMAVEPDAGVEAVVKLELALTATNGEASAEGASSTLEALQKFVTPEPAKSVRPPPPAPFANWAESLKPGDAVDLRYDGGWWEMELTRIHEHQPPTSAIPSTSGSATVAGAASASQAAGSLRYTVKSVHFDAEHTVAVDVLRPPYTWKAESGNRGMWLLREPPQVHMIDGRSRAAVEAEEKAGRAKRKKREEDPRQLGQPKDKAAHFGLGTKRKGVDGRTWEVFMTEKLTEVWVPVESKVESAAVAFAEEEKVESKDGEGDAEEEEEAGLDEAELREIALDAVLDNELRAAGISAKKGYEDLVYEAMIHLMGEAVVATHTPGAHGTAERRAWCKANCPGCKRELNILAVPGLDVIQCSYCAHWSYTNPLAIDEAGDGSVIRNDPIDEQKEMEMRIESGRAFRSSDADSMSRAPPRPSSSSVRPQEIGPAASKRCSVCAGARQRCIYGPGDAACRRCTRGGHVCDGQPGKNEGEYEQRPSDGGGQAIGMSTGPGAMASDSPMVLPPLKLDLSAFNMPAGLAPPSAPPSPPHDARIESGAGGSALGATPPVQPALPETPMLPTAPPPPVTPAPTETPAPSVEEPRLYICRWYESGYRGVFRVEKTAEGKEWEAELPFWNVDLNEYGQHSLGGFATAIEAAEAFAAAARVQPPQVGRNGVKLRPDPLQGILEDARRGEGLDILKMLRTAVREDLEDGHRENLETHASHRSESGFKGVHKSGTGRWQTQVYYEGNLYHAGHSETPEACARIYSVCMKLVDKMKEEGSLMQGSAVKRGRRGAPKEPTPGLPRSRGEATADDLQFDGEDAEELQVHLNPRADSKCQGIYFNPHINMWGTIAPGSAMLGYFSKPKEAALAFSRYIAVEANYLGRGYQRRPWPRRGLDRRHFYQIELTSCPVEGGGEEGHQLVELAVQVAECVSSLVTQVEKQLAPPVAAMLAPPPQRVELKPQIAPAAAGLASDAPKPPPGLIQPWDEEDAEAGRKRQHPSATGDGLAPEGGGGVDFKRIKLEGAWPTPATISQPPPSHVPNPTTASRPPPQPFTPPPAGAAASAPSLAPPATVTPKPQAPPQSVLGALPPPGVVGGANRSMQSALQPSGNRVQPVFKVGGLVEVMPTEDSFRGSWFEAKVLQLADDRAEIKFTAFVEDESEWVPRSSLRPTPPAPPAGDRWAVRLQVGSAVEMYNDGGWWEVDVLEISTARLTREVTFVVRSSHFGDEHEVTLHNLRPRWVWRPDFRQWVTQHDRAVYSCVMSVPPYGGSTREEIVYQDVAAFTPRAMKAGESLFCKTAEGRNFSMKMPNDVAANMRVTAKVPFTKTVPVPDDHVVLLPPGHQVNSVIHGLTEYGATLSITVPGNVAPGSEMVVRIQAPPNGRSAAASALQKATVARREGQALLSRKARNQAHGVSYRQIEQYVIARYGVCANSRLMGALAAAVRAGRLTREGKLYMPSGSMLSSQAALELEKLSEAQRAAAIAEEKRNRKLAKQALLTGRARRRQDMENRRLEHNARVRLAGSLGEQRRNAFLLEQMAVLAPFIQGAKRSLHVALGLATARDGHGTAAEDGRATPTASSAVDTEPEDDMELEEEEGEEVVEEEAETATSSDVAAASSGLESAGSSLSAPLPVEIPPETPEQLQAFGQLPNGEVSASELEALPWLEGTLQPHQVVGLNWMLRAYNNGINGILADEMGLGKTFQTIAFLAYLKNQCKVDGPSLVVAPLSVLTSWVNEFKRFAPSMRVIRLHSADQRERELMRTELLADVSNFDVVVTTYEMAASQNMKTVLAQRITWRYLVLDEGHRIKNEKTALYERLRMVKAQRKLLLTGTPLQNNLHELWALMHFLHPELFADSAVFDDAFDLGKGQIDEGVINKCGQLLSAFMLRRLKREVLKTLPHKTEALVYVPMSATQCELSRQLLLSGAQVLARMQQSTEEGREESTSANRDWTAMQSLLMSLRKCCSHPELFGSWMREVATNCGETLVSSSGKLATLDALLDELLPSGHRLVLFSGWTSMLDLIEEFLKARGTLYARLDGSTNRVQRTIDIKAFNAPGSKLSVFLCSTRAGGLGITLTSADTVVLYDSDFNPQVDLQAMDRVHRIGQARPVRIFRLVTHGTVEERIVQRARDKLYLMQQTMVGAGNSTAAGEEQHVAPASKVSRAEVINMLQFGVAGALAAQQEGETGVTRAHVRTMLGEVAAAAAARLPQVTVGIAGRTPLSISQSSTLDAAMAAAALGTTDELDAMSGAVDLEKAVAALGRSQRERTSRFIRSEETGDLVLKINDYTLNEGEKSVFDSELGGRDERSGERTHQRRMAGRDFENNSLCQLCWQGGDVLCCDNCPCVMHLACAGIEDEFTLGNTWSCPHHRCHLCQRKAHAAGGLLFRCSECPKAFCEDHLPLDAEMVGATCERFVRLGYGAVKQAAFVVCCDECKAKQLEHEAADERRQLAEGEEGEEEEEGSEEQEGGDDSDGAEAADEGSDAGQSEAAETVLPAPRKVSSGMLVEYASPLEGARGSFYSGTVVKLEGVRATFRHDELRDEEGRNVDEAVHVKHLRPMPPPSPEGIVAGAKRGSRLELRYLDGWWEVVLRKRLGGGKLRVEAEAYAAVHEVDEAQLRPAWRWSSGMWRC